MSVGIRAGGPRWCVAVRTVGRAMCYEGGKIVPEKSKVVRRGLGELCAAAGAVCGMLVCWCAMCVLACISRSRSYFDSG